MVLVGGTGKGKIHISVAIARAVTGNGAPGRFFNVVDLVNKMAAEARTGRAGRLAEHLMRLDFVVLDELGYLPVCPVRRAAPVPPDQQALRTDFGHRHYQHNLRRMADSLRRRTDDHRAARPPHPSLRHRRNRQRELAPQNPRLSPAETLARDGCAS